MNIVALATITDVTSESIPTEEEQTTVSLPHLRFNQFNFVQVGSNLTDEMLVYQRYPSIDSG